MGVASVGRYDKGVAILEFALLLRGLATLKLRHDASPTPTPMLAREGRKSLCRKARWLTLTPWSAIRLAGCESTSGWELSLRNIQG
ncbi:hypothetical protein LCGC14_0984990 [marine sediment metagenome]|uniref:Uncharacterized protein n=1 Tax=marine sediment metagenome TaxID=412755 RepID=A0A0F9NC26_9ZZZZ